MKRVKPPHGQPCNDCGLCCQDRRCPLGAAVFGRGADCPALVPEGCGLVTDVRRFVNVPADRAQQYQDAAAILIGAGRGCDALLLGEAPDLRWRARMRRLLATGKHRVRARRARRLWGFE